jgi:hypothetical protein
VYFHRELSDRVRALAERFPVFVLTGARQTGKTTLLGETFPEYHHVSLDLPSDAALAERSPENPPGSPLGPRHQDVHPGGDCIPPKAVR